MKVIAVGFDGTLCTSEWSEIGKANWPVINELKRRQAGGDRLILWTCRTGALLDRAVEWCRECGLNFNAINGNVPERIEQYGDDPRKVSADEYWDNRAVLVKQSWQHGEDFVLQWAQAGGVSFQKLLRGTSPSDAERIRPRASEERDAGKEKPVLVWLCAQCAQDMIGAGFWYQEQPNYSNAPETCRWCGRKCYGTPYLIAFGRHK